METPLVTSSVGGDAMLVCNISYPTPQELADSTPTLTWTSELSNVDLSGQNSQEIDGVYLESVLNIANVDSRYCGNYTCSANDDRIAQPVTGTASVQVGRFIFL